MYGLKRPLIGQLFAIALLGIGLSACSSPEEQDKDKQEEPAASASVDTANNAKLAAERSGNDSASGNQGDAGKGDEAGESATIDAAQ